MTVEATSTVNQRYGLLGMRSRDVEKTSVVEYRHAELTYGNVTTSETRRPFELNYGPRDKYGYVQIHTPKRWAWVTGENEVRVINATPLYDGSQEVHEFNIYRGEEINAANLTTEDGKTRLTWRETQPGDYPEATLFETEDAEVIIFYQEPRILVEAA